MTNRNEEKDYDTTRGYTSTVRLLMEAIQIPRDPNKKKAEVHLSAKWNRNSE